MNLTLNYTSTKSLITPECFNWCQNQLEFIEFSQSHHGLSLVIFSLIIQIIILLENQFHFIIPEKFIEPLFSFQQYLLIGYLIIQVFNL